ncbi:MAG: alternative ribosome rescue aminoacyl-tRNA hydrolase ArfB [Planctomycetaceae bacterium]
MLYVNETISIPDTEFSFSFARSSGPGGQNVNKVNSKAIMQWDASRSVQLPEAVRERFLAAYARRLTKEGILVISSQRYRDQGRNVADCLSKLRDLILSVAIAPTQRRATKPTRGAKQRRLSEKKANSERKQGRRRPSIND